MNAKLVYIWELMNTVWLEREVLTYLPVSRS
jgi:hypothetical protein